MGINPITATNVIEDNYIRYLTTTFRFQDNNCQQQFQSQLREPRKFIQGPILEVTPSFKSGFNVKQLVEKNILSKDFLNLREGLQVERPLYKHQEKAILKLINENRNIVVATGTGSGKTESFLIPILDSILKEKQAGTLNPGVRALLLYPMNALANDQLARLRTLLADYSDITFGRYTGETERKYAAALERYQKTHSQDPIPNELIAREQMWETPPHILLTNFAMLEYLLLRPTDSIFFDGVYAGKWSFIVIDEAHTYAGAKGIEMAMLLRRLKDRVAKSEVGRIRCIATSATLGEGRDDFPQVVDFATNLFGETFEWIKDDPLRQDVISAEYLPVVNETVEWQVDNFSFYSAWQQIVNNNSIESKTSLLYESGIDHGVPEKILKRGKEKSKSGGWQIFLYEVLKGDKLVLKLQEELQKAPQFLHELASRTFPAQANAADVVVALVDLANKARLDEQSQPLLPARYHVFVRAVEGAFISLKGEPKVFLERHEKIEKNGKEYPVFEVATCRQCGVMYLAGVVTSKGERQYLEQLANEGDKLEYFLVLSRGTVLDEVDEDEEVGYAENKMAKKDLERYLLCSSCGAIDRENSLTALCQCNKENYLSILKVPAGDEGKINLCPSCGKRSPTGIVWRFLIGTDAAASVLGTALYPQIEPQKKETSRNTFEKDDEWNPAPVKDFNQQEEKVFSQEGRKLLIFSDSRQDAAFFAPYFNRTYLQILRRSLILRVLQSHKEEILRNNWRVQDLVGPLRKELEKSSFFPKASKQELENEVWKWVIYEMVAMDRRNSLEGLGLLGFSLAKPDRWSAPKPLMRPPWNLTEEEVWTLYQILLNTLRTKGAILFPEHVSPEDEFFQPRNREFYFRNYSDKKKGILGWNSSALNSRLDYLKRLAARLNLDITDQDCRNVLKNIWDRSLNIEKGGIWQHHFFKETMPNEGIVYRLRHDVWQIQSALVNENVPWYICDQCHSLTMFNIRGTCPNYRCNGTLKPGDPKKLFRDNHYFNLYLNTEPLPMRAEEHTAQLNSESAADLQKKFVDGDINVLSCSTTFELGVDVGELETVFLRNIPPSAANYIQRAGRAGRRADTTAFALSFAQRRSHDLAHYQEPWRMVSGKISAPHFKVENKKIIRRHVFAVALSAFWNRHPNYFGKVEDFFFASDSPGTKYFKRFLDERPAQLLHSLQRIVPKFMHESLRLKSWGWAKDLFEGEEILIKAAEDVINDVKKLEEKRNELFKENKNIDHISKLIKTITKKDIIGFLSTHNVIPKYGFPVDVVELQILHHGEEAKKLQLERDLKIALSEYAPGSQLVAGGKLWTSRYIKKSPNKVWEAYKYALCDYCSSYHRRRLELEEEIKTCPLCGTVISGKNQGIFIKPEFGFIASRQKPANPGEEKPKKTYTTRVYYSGEAKEESGVELELQGIKLEATLASRGKLAVINNAGARGFKICYKCGYAEVVNKKSSKDSHDDPWGRKCNGKLNNRLALGHEFETDIIKLQFNGYEDGYRGFWLSLLYGLLEGISTGLHIERDDLDGCLYPTAGNPAMPSLIIFDDVPGGAGHVRRICNKESLLLVLNETLKRLQRCNCGGKKGNTSCYGCLRNYRNQYCHGDLKRGIVIDFLKNVISGNLK